jgi:hypothetical protein
MALEELRVLEQCRNCRKCVCPENVLQALADVIPSVKVLDREPDPDVGMCSCGVGWIFYPSNTSSSEAAVGAAMETGAPSNQIQGTRVGPRGVSYTHIRPDLYYH